MEKHLLTPSPTGEGAPGKGGRSMLKTNTVSGTDITLRTSRPHASAEDDDSDDDATDVAQPSKKDMVAEIPRHEELGWPMIPRRGSKTLPESKSIVRAYVTATYRKPTFVLFLCRI
jgi:hypothetical protein